MLYSGKGVFDFMVVSSSHNYNKRHKYLSDICRDWDNPDSNCRKNLVESGLSQPGQP